MGELAFDQLRAITNGRFGVIDAACPLCGTNCHTPSNRIRKVLRIWDDGEFITYKCARCDVSGWAKGSSEQWTRRSACERQPIEDRRSKADLAQFLWSRSRPLIGSPAETYLRSRSCYLPSDALRFLPGNSNHPPAMIARFGTDGPVSAVHLTKLKPDGSGKAGTDCDKITIGPSVGLPIVVHSNPERGELLEAEGIEDALSLAIATGWTAYAAGSAGRLAALLTNISSSDKPYLAIDNDKPIAIRRGDRIVGYRPGAGSRALQAAKVIRPDVIPVRVWKALPRDDAPDPNKVIMNFGADVLLACIEWCEAQAMHSRGEIGFCAMEAAMARATDIFRGFTPDALMRT